MVMVMSCKCIIFLGLFKSSIQSSRAAVTRQDHIVAWSLGLSTHRSPVTPGRSDVKHHHYMALLGSLMKLWLCWHLSVSCHFGGKVHKSFLIERHELLSPVGLTEWETCMASSCFTPVTSWIRVSRWWLASRWKEATGNFRVFTLVDTACK